MLQIIKYGREEDTWLEILRFCCRNLSAGWLLVTMPSQKSVNKLLILRTTWPRSVFHPKSHSNLNQVSNLFVWECFSSATDSRKFKQHHRDFEIIRFALLVARQDSTPTRGVSGFVLFCFISLSLLYFIFHLYPIITKLFSGYEFLFFWPPEKGRIFFPRSCKNLHPKAWLKMLENPIPWCHWNTLIFN